ncbi:MAG: hypothetical protein JWO58_1916 [Chitinophagaceae bacterium]|nr:hypothetical protein [Chitinophagaceae bacterium]
MSELNIRNWVYINDQEAVMNDEQQFSFKKEDTADQKLEQLYRSLGVAYPKFFKMDAQSKLGWASAEYLCEGGKVFATNAPEERALVLSNQKSSLDTDEQYQQSLNNQEEFLPSPSVFVYTLANIVAGEICIRHGIKGENNFLISERFDAEALVNYTRILFEEELCKQCLLGWVEAYRGRFKSILWLVEKGESTDDRLFTVKNLNQLYQKSEL